MPIKRDEAPGFAAISSALRKKYGNQQVAYFDANNGFTKGSDNLLEGVGVYSSTSENPHWLYVTYGFSDLNEKESEVPGLSGYGFELTLRLRVDEDSKSAATWPCDLLNDLARAVFQMDTIIKPGTALPLGGPIAPGNGTAIHAFLIVEDPELRSIKTQNGTVAFLQVVGIKLDELELLKRSQQDLFLRIARAGSGQLLILDLNRQSFLENQNTKSLLQQSDSPDCYSPGAITCPSAEWYFMTRASVSLPVSVIEPLRKQLMERVLNGFELTLHGSDCKIVFRTASIASFSIEDTALIIELPSDTTKSFAQKLQVVAAIHNFEGIPVSIEFA